MTLQSRLSEFATALYTATSTAVTGFSAVYHYTRPETVQKAPWIVWAEDAETDSYHAGNHKQEQQMHGWVDLYTKQEFDPLCDAVQGAMNGLEHCGWKVQSVQYEDETGLIHYAWEWWFA